MIASGSQRCLPPDSQQPLWVGALRCISEIVSPSVVTMHRHRQVAKTSRLWPDARVVLTAPLGCWLVSWPGTMVEHRCPRPLRPLGQVELARADRAARGREGIDRAAMYSPLRKGLLFTRPTLALSAAATSKMPVKPSRSSPTDSTGVAIPNTGNADRV